MAPPVLPSFKFLSYPAKRSPIWKTLHQESVSGMDNPIPLWSFNRWRYEIPLTLVNSGAANFQQAIAQEWQELNALYNQLQGSFGVFQFSDPDDGSVTNQLMGIGDGVSTAFPMNRTMSGAGGFTWNEPVFAPVNPQIFTVLDWQGSQLRYSTARTNLCLQSNTFSSGSYTKNNCTVTAAGGTSPDGTNDSWTWQRSSTASAQVAQTISKASSALVYTLSIYAKPGTGNFLALGIQDGVSGRADAVFNVSTGAISTAASASAPFTNASATITAYANGFYRCTLTATSPATANLLFYWSGSTNGALVDGTDSSASTTILAFGEQLEQFSPATSYIATTTAAVTVTDYTLGTQGLITFSTPPNGGSSILWTGAFNWLCRFDDDAMEFEKFMNNLWAVRALKFTTIKTQSK